MWNTNLPPCDASEDDDSWDFWPYKSKEARQAEAARRKESYYERQERIARHPPDEDEWNK